MGIPNLEKFWDSLKLAWLSRLFQADSRGIDDLYSYHGPPYYRRSEATDMVCTILDDPFPMALLLQLPKMKALKTLSLFDNGLSPAEEWELRVALGAAGVGLARL